MLQTALGRFRLIALIEGISYLLLLFIAMPLKYGFGWDLAVRYVGWAHGVLFMAYCALLLLARLTVPWSFPRMILLFVVSLVPFGTFWADRRLKEEEAQLRETSPTSRPLPATSEV